MDEKVRLSFTALRMLAVCGENCWNISPSGTGLMCLTKSSKLESAPIALAKRAIEVYVKLQMNLEQNPQDYH